MRFTIELNHRLFFRLLKKYLLMIVLLGVLISGVCVFITIKSSTQTFMSQGELAQNDNNAGLITAYQQFVRSSNFKGALNKKIESSKWKNKETKSKYEINIAPETSSTSSLPFFTFSTTTDDANYSQYVNETAMKILITSIGKYLSGANISIVTNAPLGKITSSKQELVKPGMIGLVIGIVLGSLMAFYMEIFHGKIKDEKFIRDVYQIEDFGVVDFSSKD